MYLRSYSSSRRINCNRTETRFFLAEFILLRIFFDIFYGEPGGVFEFLVFFREGGKQAVAAAVLHELAAAFF